MQTEFMSGEVFRSALKQIYSAGDESRSEDCKAPRMRRAPRMAGCLGRQDAEDESNADAGTKKNRRGKKSYIQIGIL